MNLIGNINAIPFRRFRGGDGVAPFPSIPGMIARYSALGLTNEQMAENPVWKDLTGNGHDLQMKNFAWKGMSGVNGYVQNFNNFKNNATVNKVRIDEQSSNSIKVTILTTGISNAIYIPKNIYQFNKSYFIKISSEGYDEGDMALSFYAPSTSTATTVTVSLNPNGITEIPAIKEDDFLAVYLNVGGKVGSITIEQLPLYPGFILGDGVDDFAVTEKELNFEDTYTVYTAFIPFQNNPTRNMILCGADSKKTFSMQYSSLVYVSFIAGNNYYINADFVNGLNLFACKRNGNNICIKNLLTNKVVTGTCGDWVENAGLYYLWKNAIYASFARTAIAGQTICNGYFSTDEDDEKVLDWYKKQYPWLFPDQAWTVVGKTNEGKDRATIANITGNGNNLVLSNFGFAEGSGYGLYAENYAGGRWVQSTDRADLTWTSYSVNITSVKVASTQLYYQSYPEQPSFTVPSYKIKVYGLKDGQTLSYKQVTSEGQQIYKISEDGIYTLPSFLFKANGDWYGFTLDKIQETCDITIEQIPEYEGYLVTDGVDDKVVSKQFKFGENFTVILDFKFLVKKISYCGFDLSAKVRIQNIQDSGVYVVLKGNKTLIPSNVVRAVTSEGKVYDENWNEYNIVPGNISSSYTMVNLGFDGSIQFAESATKLAGIYSSTLSKDDCIKAYNYLQTLKSK